MELGLKYKRILHRHDVLDQENKEIMMKNVQTERKFEENHKEMKQKDKKINELESMLSKLLGKNEDQFDQVRGVKMRA